MGDLRHYGSLSSPRRSPDPPPPVYYERRNGKFAGGGGGGSAWCFSDPETKRKRRVASYKTYSVEGNVKAKIRRGLRWIKERCNDLVHGY